MTGSLPPQVQAILWGAKEDSDSGMVSQRHGRLEDKMPKVGLLRRNGHSIGHENSEESVIYISTCTVATDKALLISPGVRDAR